MININVKKERTIKRLLLFNLGSIVVALIVGAIAFLFFYDKIVKYDLLRFIVMMFSDFYQIMQFSLSKNPYLLALPSSYPPLAILILYFPYALISRNVVHLSALDILRTPEFWISFCLFYIIFLTAAAFLLKRLIGLKGKSFACFYLMILTSGMVLYTLARGNVVISAFVFLLFFLAFYNSDKKVLRELALVSLALAGAIKIYPLFFGILLLKDKKYFESVRVAVYSVVLFFVPFLFFEGGFSNIKLFIANLGEFSLSDERMLYPLNMSSSGLVYKFFNALGKLFNTPLMEAGHVISVIAIVLISVAAVVGALLAKNKLSLYIICTATMLLIPSVSYYYSAIFLLIPLIEFLNGYETLDKTRKTIYLVLFFVLICIVCFLLGSLLSILLSAALFYEAVRNIKAYLKTKKKPQAATLQSQERQ